jgi:hypothetical protein
LYEVHASFSSDRRSRWTDHPELKPESTGANGDGLSCNLLALFGAPEDINEIDTLASRKRGGSCSKCWEAGEASDTVAKRLWRWVHWKDLPACRGEGAQDAVGGAVWAGGGADDCDHAALRQHAAHERVGCGGIWGAPFGGLYGCP